jgi:alkanesulfonate monooxygenase SsuD/methylene tetrahydromethanopterin reductase-like flavin-dependent oxidoreductase (luciferase family)
VKFGLAYNTAYYGADPDLMAAAARHAEECGFESFYLPEHIVLYPGATAGPVSFPADLAVADPLECLAYVAAVTSKLLLGTADIVICPPPGPKEHERRPVNDTATRIYGTWLRQGF